MQDEKELQNLLETAEKGRKAKIASEFLNEFLTQERAKILLSLETAAFTNAEQLLEPVLYLRLLRSFDNLMKNHISLGEIAEKELSEDGDN